MKNDKYLKHETIYKNSTRNAVENAISNSKNHIKSNTWENKRESTDSKQIKWNPISSKKQNNK